MNLTAITHETPGPETDRNDLARAEGIVAEAMKAFDVALEVLSDAIDALRAEKTVGEQEVTKDLRAMNNAYMFALQMREKARDAGDRHGAAAGGGGLDLDAAREEIGLRLACLEAASGGGRVSGKPE
ncbi:hypothetical protein D9R08_11895 [Rhodophyticola porphyridii]|uniref:Uncharacterized protein n=1 Tax=Rhodophyticola porphyridii TaxID=1852017 RepID=A0A3L9Y016_9RHOB|nr:hypothetical protein D9R08_11895 [Rhodophyticola porphyridii]